MGYQTASITLRDGRVIEDVLIVDGTFAEVRDDDTILFPLKIFLISHSRTGRGVPPT